MATRDRAAVVWGLAGGAGWGRSMAGLGVLRRIRGTYKGIRRNCIGGKGGAAGVYYEEQRGKEMDFKGRKMERLHW